VGTGVGVGAGPGVVLVGLGLGLGLGLVAVEVGVGVAVDVAVGVVAVGVGVGVVEVVEVGVGVGVVAVGVGVGVGVGVVEVGVGVGVVAVGVGVGVVEVGVGVGVVPVGVGVGGAGVAVCVGGAIVQAGTVIVSSSRVTAPLRASARPAMVSPVSTEIDVRARMLPAKSVLVPRVAELPTCQNTLQAWASPVRTMLLAESVMSVEGAWKMKTAFGSPPASRVSDPPTSSEEDALYTPGARVWPAPMKAGMLPVGLRPAASL
jgi:hypothetical protein